MASNNAATWIAFASLFKRSIATRTPRSFGKLPNYNYNRTSTRPQQARCFFKATYERNNGKPPVPIRRIPRTEPTKKALKQIKSVAREAERSQQVIHGKGIKAHVNPELETRNVTAYCAAESYNLSLARHALVSQGFVPDPSHTGLYPQVLHALTPQPEDSVDSVKGDIFVFPSGTVVTWNVPETLALQIVQRWLPPAAVHSHLDKLEAEDMEYIEDPTRSFSKIVGDTIVLATGSSEVYPASATITADHSTQGQATAPSHEAETVLAKVAFSSALARSTKLAVLESQLNAYFDTTKTIPTILSKGSRLRFSRAFILQKTGELLNMRAQLNLYSELTDSLPDLFWDSPHELGLESYYEKAGRALDVGSRIKTLNERLDYANEIAAVLRERLSEKHSTELEWLIIALISIEVAFGILHLWRERGERMDPESKDALMKEYLRRELGRA
ncbi:hypothetical protein LTS10_001962 [Elasticomyces elasticus]|nr:hypothetical protein LTS10_001962 [Elasticomyces elasticus]